MSAIPATVTSQTTHARDSEVFRGFADILRWPIGNGIEMVYSPVSGARQLMSGQAAAMLQSCQSFATLDQHAQRIAEQFQIAPTQLSSVRRQLEAFSQGGLLYSQQAIVDKISRSAPSALPANITSLAVPTRNRTESLHKCIDSYAQSARQFERQVRFLVVDGSEMSSTEEANKAALKSIQSKYGVEIYVAGKEERELFAEALAKRSELSRAFVDFALMNPHGCPVSTGASRNSILLSTVGEMILHVDDDTVCRVAPAPDFQQGVKVTSEFDPTDFWFLEAQQKSVTTENFAIQDVFALHEQLLGKSAASCMKPDALNVDELGSALMRRFDSAHPQVLVTQLGFAGDSGMQSSGYFLTLQGASRQRLLESEAVYRNALNRHALMRAVNSMTLSDRPFCMAMSMGIDNRGLLAPFMPVQRNSDGIFAQTLRAAFEDTMFGHLPWMIAHENPSTTEGSRMDLWRNTNRVRISDILLIMVRGVKANSYHSSGVERLKQIGQMLMHVGSLPRPEFEEIVAISYWTDLSRRMALLSNMLQTTGGTPGFWKNDVLSHIGAVQKALAERSTVYADDLVEVFGTEPARTMTQTIVYRYGELIRNWQQLTEAARDLKVRGVELGQKI